MISAIYPREKYPGVDNVLWDEETEGEQADDVELDGHPGGLYIGALMSRHCRRDGLVWEPSGKLPREQDKILRVSEGREVHQRSHSIG